MGAVVKGKRGREVTVDLEHMFDGLAEIIGGQFEHDRAALKGFAVEVATKLNGEAIKLAKAGDHVFTREYIESFDVIDAIDGADAVNSAPWAADLEVGQPPGRRVDYDELHKWVLFKWVARGKCTPDEAGQVTTNIKRKIERQGTEPNFIMRNAMQRAPKFIATAARRALPGRGA